MHDVEKKTSQAIGWHLEATIKRQNGNEITTGPAVHRVGNNDQAIGL